MASDWFYTSNGRKCGPVTSQVLKALADSGGIVPTDLIWKEGMNEWKLASTAKGLFSPTNKPTSNSANTHSPPVLPSPSTAAASGPLPDAEEYDEEEQVQPIGLLGRMIRFIVRATLLMLLLIGLAGYGYCKATGSTAGQIVSIVATQLQRGAQRLKDSVHSSEAQEGRLPNDGSPAPSVGETSPEPEAKQLTGNIPEESKGDEPEVVVAEGTGRSPDDALRDAFRFAVRRIVGAVVDAETLVKNDEVIDDKVLTYSAGLIKRFDEVIKPTKGNDGLYRVTIKAEVIRKGVIEKLKAAKVTIRQVDGKGMFDKVKAELASQKAKDQPIDPNEVAEAQAILAKQFENFPVGVVKATVIGEPVATNTTDVKATIRIKVQYEHDPDAYQSFTNKLEDILENMAKDKGDLNAKLVEQSNSRCDFPPTSFSSLNRQLAQWMPRAFTMIGSNPEYAVAKSGTYIVVVNKETQLGDRLTGRWYLIDTAISKVLFEKCYPKMETRLRLLNRKGDQLFLERFRTNNREHPSLLIPFFLDKYPPNAIPEKPVYYKIVQPGGSLDRSEAVNYTGDQFFSYYSITRGSLFWLSPRFLGGSIKGTALIKSFILEHEITMSLEELREISNVKVELSLDE